MVQRVSFYNELLFLYMIFNVNTQNKASSKLLPIGIGAIISVFLIVFGYFFWFDGSLIGSRAADMAPRDTTVSEITENSAKVVWATGQETQGVIEYGTSPTSLNFFAPESEKTQSHEADLTLLSPSTTYYFQIRITDQKYDNSGVPWTFTTKSPNSSDNTSASPTPRGSANFTTSPTCNETDCEKIKEKFFSGCDTQDYIKCIKAKDAN